MLVMAMEMLSKLLVLIGVCSLTSSLEIPTEGVSLSYIIVQNGDRDCSNLQNATIFTGNDISNSRGLVCATASKAENNGEWIYPDGSRVGGLSSTDSLYVLPRIQRVELYRRGALSKEGIYTCRIEDESGVVQSLYVGIYSGTGQAPVLSSPVALNVESMFPSILSSAIFTLTCTSSAFPPTTVAWTRDGQPLPAGSSSESYQVLRDAESSTFENVLRVRGGPNAAGNYRCTLSNDRGDSSTEIRITSPSDSPENLNVDKLGNNVVAISWTPPSDVCRYIVTLSDTDFIVIDDPSATTANLTGLVVGETYSITVQAYGDLPGPVSSPVTVLLQAPPPPSGVTTFGDPSATNIPVQWTAVPAVIGYEIAYTPVEGACDEIEGGRVVVAGTTNHTLRGLEEFTTYRIEVRSRGIEGTGLPSDPVSLATLRKVPPPPQMVSAIGHLSPRGFSVSWRNLDCRDVNDNVVELEYILRYRLSGSEWVDSLLVAASPAIVDDPSLVSFMDYEFEVAAVNTLGMGGYSYPVKGVIFEGPGPVTALRTSPDIVSILVTWEAPSNQREREALTDYEVTHRLSILGADPIRRTLVNGNTTSMKISALLPGVTYDVIVRAVIQGLRGTPLQSVQSTQTLGKVVGVTVSPVNATSVSVAWLKLDSGDVSGYRVYYFRADKKSRKRESEPAGLRVPAESSFVVVSGLMEGAEYQFQVVGLVVVNGLEREGMNRSEGFLVVVGGVKDSRLPSSSVTGIIIACLVILILLVVFIIITCLIWRKRTSGTYVVKKTKKPEGKYELQPKNSNSPTNVLPLQDFEPFLPFMSTIKPFIQQYPTDTSAMEGQRVTFQPKVSGSPPPTVAWYHDGSMVSSDYAREVNDNGALVFVCVELKHAGTYRFTVSNSAGSIQGQVQLSVYSEESSKHGEGGGGSDCLLTGKVQVGEFGRHVEGLHANGDNNFREQFLRLSSGEEEHAILVALRPENKILNRFQNITVYDDNRVQLKPIGNIPSCQHDYINACHINGYFMQKKFVVTQGPTDLTVIDFWRMVWQLRTPTIVMITNPVEAGRSKCSRYWPETDTADYGPFRVFLSGETVFGHYVIRTFHVNFTLKTQNPFKVVQYHFIAWPDHGAPDYVAPMLAFHRRIKAEHKSMLGPMLVHCSAGVGRSGTFVALDIALQQASGEGCIDIPAVINKLRQQRMKMVQTLDQYVFLHDAILEVVVCGNTQIPTHDLKRSIEALDRWDPTTGRSGFQSQFQVLEQLSPKPDEVGCDTAKVHWKRNRYLNYLPLDKHRVHLKAEQPDYIHATFVDGYKLRKKFIIAQGPLEDTCKGFWKMVYERNCVAIVMLSGMVEREEEVCYKYWPTRGAELYGRYEVSLLEHTMHDGFLERTYSVCDSESGSSHRVAQFQVINWDQYGITFNMMAILTIISRVTALQRRGQHGPILVHCSDTVTRSGIFCAVSNAIDCCRIDNTVDIFQVVKVLRTQRPGAIPLVDHYQAIHDILLCYIKTLSDQN